MKTRGWVRVGMTTIASLAMLAPMSLSGTAMASARRVAAPSGTFKIGLSNSYDGNTWRHEMVANFTQEAKLLKSQGKISYGIVNSNNSSSQQISQLDTMILQGYKAIVIDAASPTALNGVIAKACAAGIKVVVFDSLATAPCAYKVEVNYVRYGEIEMNYVAHQLHGKGNVLEIRGIAGTSVDTDISKGIHIAIKRYPGMKIVGSVHGDWTESIAQSAVEGILPSLPTVNAVVDQGGDGSGAYAAFQALHKPIPLIIMGNRGTELRVWKQQLAKDPSYHTISISSMPGMSTVALNEAYLLLAGQKVPKVIYVPNLEITKAHLNAWLAVTPAAGVATAVFGIAQTKSFIAASADGHPDYVYSGLPIK